MNEHIKDIKIQSPVSIAWVALLKVKQAIKSFDGYQAKYLTIHIIHLTNSWDAIDIWFDDLNQLNILLYVLNSYKIKIGQATSDVGWPIKHKNTFQP